MADPSRYLYPGWVRAFGLLFCLAFGGYVGFDIGARILKGRIPDDPALRAKWLEEEVRYAPRRWRDLAFAYVASKQYDKAPAAFRKTADFYVDNGDVDAGLQMERAAEKWESDARIYIARTATPELAKAYDTGAKFEPPYGCYIGAFIEHEDMLKNRYVDEAGKKQPTMKAFDDAVGVKHAMLFRYVGWGKPFPKKWAEDLKANKAAGQIAFEPEDLDKVQDDDYLRQFARDCQASGIPIFLRYASEMNGDWTPYHGDPKKYIEKWRLVHKVMKEEAPNVAMLWCVFEVPIKKIEQYYPGADYVDWVGVNVYSVPYLDNDLKRRADWRNPADGVKFVYSKYAARHPIMIAEYAASHLSSLDNVYRGEEARIKLSQFYACLPRLYPRIKAVCWLSMNAISHAIPGRQKNNYSLLYDMPKAERYKQMVSGAYFLKDWTLQGPARLPEVVTDELRDGEEVRGKLALSAWVKTYTNTPRVVWYVNDKPVTETKEAGTYPLGLDTTKLANGPARIRVEVHDGDNRVSVSQEVPVVVAN